MEEIAKSRPKRRNVKISKDPQSVAARHRRERISDRIRVLQRLVPGDIHIIIITISYIIYHIIYIIQVCIRTLDKGGDGIGASRGSQYVQGSNPLAATLGLALLYG